MTRPLNTPVVFCIFRRPETTRRVFERIAQAQPRQLFVIADGPRSPEEAPRCEQTRAIIQVDWPCEVRYNYAEQNMGLRARISSGLDWVFSQVEQAIILEDDCVPHPTFFRFCEELLEYYKDDERVMHITGANFGYARPRGVTASYYFTGFAHVWGWATWRRAWQRYDVTLAAWHDAATRRRVLRRFPWWFRWYWASVFDALLAGRISTWDYQWMFACHAHDGLCIMPYENTIANVGASPDATNTQSAHSSMINRPLQPIAFPLEHPPAAALDAAANRYSSVLTWRANTRLGRVTTRLLRRLQPGL
jgi:hypothetical protein